METTYEQSIFEEEKVTVQYASFWERLGAMILDYLVLLPLYLVNIYNTFHWRSVGVMILVATASLIYKPLFEYLNSATPGKRGVGITITNYEYGKPSLTNILLRNCFYIGLGMVSLIGTLIIYGGLPEQKTQAFTGFDSIPQQTIDAFLLSGSIFLVYIVDVIVLLADKKNRSLHDIIGKTYVIRKGK